jgi:hypothetical protein
MKNTKEKVEYLLRKTPHLRDDDYKLIATFWWNEIGGKTKCEMITGMDFLTMFSQGKLTHPESLRRVRAKLQEQNSELRGESYKRRNDEGTENKTNIHSL